MGSLLIQVIEVALSLGVVVLLARLLGASGYGVYAVAFAMMSLGALVTQAGLPHLVVRETARGQRLSDWPTVRGVWRWANFTAIALSLFIVACGAMGLWLGWVRDELLRETLAWALGLLPLLTLLAIRTASLRGLRHILAGMLSDQLLRPALFAGGLLVVSLLPGGAITPDKAMALALAATLAAYIAGSCLLRQYRPPELSAAKPH